MLDVDGWKEKRLNAKNTHKRVPLGPDIFYSATYISGMHLCTQSTAAALCVAILLLLLLQLVLLFVIVRRMAKLVAGSLNLIPVFYFSLFKRDVCVMHPLAVLRVAFTASICYVHPR